MPPAELPAYQGTAVIGNSRTVIPIDCKGTFINLFNPSLNQPHMHNPHDWIYKGKTPPHTGAFLGLAIGGKVVWLRDSREISQDYAEDTNILETSYRLPDGVEIVVRDFVLPGVDVIIRHLTADRPVDVIAFQNLDLGGKPAGDSASKERDFLVQETEDGAVVVGGSISPEGWHIGEPETFKDVRLTRLNGRLEGSGDVASAVRWRETCDLTIIYSVGISKDKALAQAKAALEIPVQQQIGRTERYWRDWLKSGRELGIPDPRYRRLYARSLLTLKLLQNSETGAISGGARPYWTYCWPRDGAFSAAAFDLAGHHEEAESLYRFLARVQLLDGSWRVRHYVDEMSIFPDSRAPQIDAAGYFPWGVWLHTELTGDDSLARELYPQIKLAAEHIIISMNPETGLPGPSSDYWEYSSRLDYFLSNAIVCAAGLRSAACLADMLDDSEVSGKCRQSAIRIRSGIEEHLWDDRRQAYRRGLREFPGVDSAACWAISPFGVFAPDDERMALNMGRIESRLKTRTGGIIPGEDWPKKDVWVPETMFALLYHLGSGNRSEAMERFRWVADSASCTGALGERISSRSGLLESTTPLAWSHALFIFAAVEAWGPGVPKPPGIPPSPPARGTSGAGRGT